MSTISNTVTAALNDRGLGHYSSQAQPVIAALEAREQAALETLRTFAESKGLHSSVIENLFVEAGLVEPAPEPEPEVAASTSGGTIEAVLAAVEALRGEITAIKRAAARHGVNV